MGGYTASALWLVVAALSLMIPAIPPTDAGRPRTWIQILGLDALTLLCPFSLLGATCTAREPSTAEHLSSAAGIFVGSLKQRLHKNVDLTAWNVLTENVFNSALVLVDAGGRDAKWSLFGMAIKQDAAHYRGGINDSLLFMPQSESSWAFSGRIRNVLGKFRWQLNYTRITAHGRYLMPREWGRDPFFTFLPREPNEGAGDVHAASLNLIWKAKNGWRIQVDGGLYQMPDLTEVRLNKYAMPSYMQFDVNAQYQFAGDWKGLAVQLLVLTKLPVENDLSARQSIHKVDMLHADFIINYVF